MRIQWRRGTELRGHPERSTLTLCAADIAFVTSLTGVDRGRGPDVSARTKAFGGSRQSAPGPAAGRLCRKVPCQQRAVDILGRCWTAKWWSHSDPPCSHHSQALQRRLRDRRCVNCAGGSRSVQARVAQRSMSTSFLGKPLRTDGLRSLCGHARKCTLAEFCAKSAYFRPLSRRAPDRQSPG